MTGYLLAALAGVPVGYVLKCAVLVAGEYLDRTPATTGPTPARPSAEQESLRRYTAADILGFYDRGARWHPPTYPGGLAAWDRRNERTA